jgi:UDP-2,3-diacylglucosamine pyrophosphatase LpxH
MHVPFTTPGIWRAQRKFWLRGNDRKFRSAAVPAASGDFKRQQEDPVTRDFIAYLKTEKQLKGILAGHLHITVQERFSPTAIQYVVGGNFMFHGQEVTFS